MNANTETVAGRVSQARVELTPVQLVTILAIAAAIGFTLLFLQDPLAHDSLHNFRHSIGITCH